MTTFLIVQLEDESRANEVFPSSWYADGECAIPTKNVHKAANKMRFTKYHGNTTCVRFSQVAVSSVIVQTNIFLLHSL